MAAKRSAVRSASLRVVCLEERCVPANIVVNIAGEDPNPGNGMISFRDALAIANSNNQPSTITFAPGITTVSITDSAPLAVTTAGQANETVIDGNGVVVLQSNGDSGTVLTVGTFSSAVTPPPVPTYLQLRGLTLTGGADVASRFGGGGGGLMVFKGATTTLDHVTVSGNQVFNPQGGLVGGGGIYNAGVLRVTDCSVTNNFAVESSGGGIYNVGQIVIGNSTIADNTAGQAISGGNGVGGGIFNDGQLAIQDSTLSGNTAGADGGGIYSAPNPSTTVAINCTLSANTAYQAGGGIEADGSTTLTNLTVTNNRTVAEGSGAGGGLFSTGVTANNTIISGNFAGTDAAALADDLAGSLAAASSHNLIGGNAKLGPLANNGGPTQTHALLPGSPAIDAGSNGLAVDESGNLLTSDQRGDPRIYGGIFSGTVDIGAVESQGVAPPNPSQLIVAGSGPGGAPRVSLYDTKGNLDYSFLAFNPAFRGGVTVAVGDVNGDGVGDVIVGAGSGGGPQIKVFDGTRLSTTQSDSELAPAAVLYSFYAYDPKFTGGVAVAAGDVNGDGKADIVTGTGPGGGPHVKVFSGANGSTLASFFAYSAGFTGGVNVAAGDVNGDGKADVVTGVGPGGGPHVKAFDGAGLAAGGSAAASAVSNPLQSFYAYAAAFTGGVTVAVGDVNGDGKPDIVTGTGRGGGPHVRAFDDFLNPVANFFAYNPGFTGGVSVATVFNGSNTLAIVTGPGPGGPPQLKLFGNGGATLGSFQAFDPSFLGGVFVG